MKKILLITTFTVLTCCVVNAGSSLKDDIKKNNSEAPKIAPKEMLKKHGKDSTKIAGEQDELSADVQDLVQEQTDPKVMKLLNEAEELMGEATELLENKKTDGGTLAIETEIIEKIYEAAKKKQQSSGS